MYLSDIEWVCGNYGQSKTGTVFLLRHSTAAHVINPPREKRSNTQNHLNNLPWSILINMYFMIISLSFFNLHTRWHSVLLSVTLIKPYYNYFSQGNWNPNYYINLHTYLVSNFIAYIFNFGFQFYSIHF